MKKIAKIIAISFVQCEHKASQIPSQQVLYKPCTLYFTELQCRSIDITLCELYLTMIENEPKLVLYINNNFINIRGSTFKGFIL